MKRAVTLRRPAPRSGPKRELRLIKTVSATPARSKQTTPGGKHDPEASKPVEGHYELNPLLQKALYDELDGVAAKVNESLAACINSEVGVSVSSDKFTEQFIGLMALSVTKRLLNVQGNNLKVQLKFPGKPTQCMLNKLKKKYNIAEYVTNKKLLYIVSFNDINDFDAMCTQESIVQNGMEIKVYSLYNIASCPQQLRKNPYDEAKIYLRSQKALKEAVHQNAVVMAADNTEKEKPNSNDESQNNVIKDDDDGKEEPEVDINELLSNAVVIDQYDGSDEE